MKLIRTKAVVSLEFYLVCGLFCLFAVTFSSAQSCTPPPAGIVSWWAGQSNALDQIGTNNGIWGGTPAYAPGEVGLAFNFNGTFVRVPDSPSLHFTTGMTAEAWVKPSNVSNFGAIINKADAVPQNQTAFALQYRPGGFPQFWVANTNNQNAAATDTNSLPLNQWTHVAGTYDGTMVKLYLNGVLVSSNLQTGNILSSPDDVGIGDNVGGDTNGQSISMFIGLIDEPTLYDRALTASEIAAIYNAGSAGKCPPTESSPMITVQPQPTTVAEGSNALFTVTATGTAPLNYQWQFNSAPITGATLSSLNLSDVQPTNQGNYSVTVSNIAGFVVSSNAFLTVTVSSSCTPPAAGLISWWAGQSNTLDQVGANNGIWSGGGPSYGPGEVGAAFSFNGNDCVRVADAPSLHFTNAMTVEAWVDPSAYGNSILVKYDAVLGVNQSSFSFSLDSSGHVYLTLSSNGIPTDSFSVTSSNTVPLNQWTHVAGTYDRSNLKVYINGALAASLPSTNAMFAGTDALGIGANIGGISGQVAGFRGLIDEPSLYNTALSASQIAAIYNAGAAGKCSSVVAPTITVQPQPTTVPEGSNALFTVTATGTAPLNYQWQFNNGPISGATTSSLSIPDAQGVNQGNYSVIVANAAGSITSSNALLTVQGSSCTPPAAGLVSWWAGQSNTLDQVGGNNGSWRSGGPAYGAGEVGTAFSFNGNDCVAVPDASNLHFVNAMTAEAWVNPSAFGGNGASILVKYDEVLGVNQSSFSFSLDSGGHVSLLVSFDGTPGNSSLVTGTNTVPLNQWTHIAATYDRSNLKVYINGALAASLPSTNAIFAGTDALGIGANIGGVPPGQQAAGFNGLIDEPSLYNTALSASQIAAIYNAGAAGKCSSVVAPTITVQPQPTTVPEGSNALFTVTATGTAPLTYQWQFNSTPITGATASNLSIPDAQGVNQGNYSVIVANGAGSVTSSNALLTVEGSSCTPPPAGIVSWWAGQSNALDQVSGNNGSWRSGGPAYGPGEVGTAFSFNGNDCVAVPDALDLHFVNAMTAEAWVKPFSYGGSILVKYDEVLGVNQSSFSFSLDPSGHVYLTLSSNGIPQGSFSVTSSNTVPLNQWTHVAGTYDRSNLKVYINGVLAGTLPATNPIFAGTDALGIGANIGGVPAGQQAAGFNGLIDEPSLYNTALSASQIAAIYNAGPAGKCAGSPLAPTIKVQPVPESVTEGGSALFTVTATGTAPLTYQWQFNNASISGATASSLSLADVQPANQGNYSVIVSNVAGFVISSNALLTVVIPSCTPAPSGIVSWWTGQSNTLDQVGGNNGIWGGTPAYAPGEVGLAFSFNSTFVRIPDSPSLHFTTGMTAEAWVNPSSLNNFGAIINKADAVPQNQTAFALQYRPGGLPQFWVANTNNQNASAIDSNSLPLNQWTHVAGTYDGSMVKLYINGVLVSSNAQTGNILSSTDDVGIGDNVGGDTNGQSISMFIGLIDEPTLYNRALTAGEIAAIYNAGAAGKCPAQIAPSIVTQPQNQTISAGSNATFNVAAAGSVPLSYQWLQNSNAISGATNSSLVVTNVQLAESGFQYSVIVSNLYGTANSSNAILTVMPPPSVFIIPNTTATSGIVTVPINFISDGNENAIGFSVNFNSSLLTFVSADTGTNASVTLIVNSNDASSGQIGLAISLPVNTTFNAGSNVLADLTFDLVPPANTNTTVTPLTFGNTPIPEQVYDPTPNQLAAVFTNGSLTIPYLGFEGDVFPVPNGDGKVLLSDWVQEGRFVAGLDVITNASEFQRADCAPRSTLGDGRLTVSDWVQTGRYAAGLDPLTVAGGPTTPKPGNGNNNVVTGNGPTRVITRSLSVAPNAVQAGQACQLSIMLSSQGDENGLEFSLSFSPAVWSYVSASLGSNASGASLILNTNQIASGNLGVLLGLPIGSSFAAGNNQVLTLTLQAAPIAAGNNWISLNSVPLPEEISDTTANALSSGFISGSVTIVPVVGPKLSLVPGKGNGLSFSYPSSASGFILQSTASLASPNWTNAVATFTTNENTITVTGSVGHSQMFYRLVSP